MKVITSPDFPADNMRMWKLFASWIFQIFSHLTVSFAVIVANDRLPNRDKNPPLPDIILDNIAYVPWAGQASEVCMLSLILIFIAVLALHCQRILILQRTFIMVGTVYLLRTLCIVSTSLPVPDVNRACDVYPDAGLGSKLKRAFSFYASIGMDIWGNRTCGDYIFSGHTAMLTFLRLFIREYTSKSKHIIHAVVWVLNMSGIVLILLCKWHYTIDVIVAYYVTVKVFSMYHLLLANKNHQERTLPWPFSSVFNWLESDSYRNDHDTRTLLPDDSV